MRLPSFLAPRVIARAHCDLPCGVYDPAQARSKILDKLVNDPVVRTQILDAVKHAIQGKRGRILPVYTQTWANNLRGYQGETADQKRGHIDFMANDTFLVRDGQTVFGSGPGFAGTAGVDRVHRDLVGQQTSQRQRVFAAA